MVVVFGKGWCLTLTRAPKALSPEPSFLDHKAAMWPRAYRATISAAGRSEVSDGCRNEIGAAGSWRTRGFPGQRYVQSPRSPSGSPFDFESLCGTSASISARMSGAPLRGLAGSSDRCHHVNIGTPSPSKGYSGDPREVDRLSVRSRAR